MKINYALGLLSSAKEGKKEERDIALSELSELTNKLAQINNAIRSEEVIAGTVRSLAIKRAAIVLGMAAAAGISYAADATYNDSEGIAYLKHLFGMSPQKEIFNELVYRLPNLAKKAEHLGSESQAYLQKQVDELVKLPKPYGVKRAEKYVDTLEKAVNEQIEREKILQNETVSKKAAELGQTIKREASKAAKRAKEYFNK